MESLNLSSSATTASILSNDTFGEEVSQNYSSSGDLDSEFLITIAPELIRIDELEVLKSVPLFLLLVFFSISTMLGNALVILSVWRENSLHSPTNYFIASLASADFLVGSIVMPFEAITELLGGRWLFGHWGCDLWRAFDVLLATASILNLSVISVDRYWAISEPFSYPTKMTSSRAGYLIAIVWICSSIISIPAIFYWRWTRDEPFPPGACLFTDDPIYLITSSMISFYIPLFVMLFTYFRIYRAAVRQTRSIQQGAKFYYDKEMEVRLRMRIHRGGSIQSQNRGRFSFQSPLHLSPPERHSPEDFSLLRDVLNTQQAERNRSRPFSESEVTTLPKLSPRCGSRSAGRGSFLKRKLTKFAKEKKAAKTLATVLGVFIVCWMPFFVLNLMAGLCPSCRLQEHVVFTIFTWLGWVNSAMNPIIYAAWNRDFRRAFGRILCFSRCCKRIELALARCWSQFRR